MGTHTLWKAGAFAPPENANTNINCAVKFENLAKILTVTIVFWWKNVHDHCVLNPLGTTSVGAHVYKRLHNIAFRENIFLNKNTGLNV